MSKWGVFGFSAWLYCGLNTVIINVELHNVFARKHLYSIFLLITSFSCYSSYYSNVFWMLPLCLPSKILILQLYVQFLSMFYQQYITAVVDGVEPVVPLHDQICRKNPKMWTHNATLQESGANLLLEDVVMACQWWPLPQDEVLCIQSSLCLIVLKNWFQRKTEWKQNIKINGIQTLYNIFIYYIMNDR